MSGIHNLPPVPTPLIGRDDDAQAAVQLLTQPEVRLVTLTGPAGVGKTRLAVEVATRVASLYADGAHFVDLAPVENAELVPRAIAAVLGVDEAAGQVLSDQLRNYLAQRHVLLVLDNFEQVVPAAPLVADWLAAATRLDILVTSRAALNLRWERQYPVPSLTLPGGTVDAAAVEQAAATALFLQRARALRPDFTLSEANATAIYEICHRLDGLPLAIELAAAQTDIQSPQAILDGLQSSGLDALSSGTSDMPARQQTLRDAIAWSERLLPPAERSVFHQLAVFSGGCTLDAAEAVCEIDGAGRPEVRAAVTSLVRKNLLRFEPSAGDLPGRYRLLEMMREYGLEQLRLAGKEAALRARHLAWCISLADAAEPEIHGRHEKFWMDLLDRDHDNLRAALAWCQSTGRIQEGLRLVAGVAWLWQIRGFLAEGTRWCATFLAPSSQSPDTLRLRALIQAGWLAHVAGQGDSRATYSESALLIAREAGDRAAESWALQIMARGPLRVHQKDQSRLLAEEALAAAEASGEAAAIRWSLFFLAEVARAQGRLREAAELNRQTEALNREAGDSQNLMWNLANLGSVELLRANYEAAIVNLREALTLARELSHRTGMATCFWRLAEAAGAQGNHEQAATLHGIAQGCRDRMGSGAGYLIGDKSAPTVRSAIGAQRYEASYSAGHSMTLDTAFTYALQPSPAHAPTSAGLTPRETEIIAMVALGLTNRQIAEHLVISVRTAERHVANIFVKLDLSTRTQLAAWALQHPETSSAQSA